MATMERRDLILQTVDDICEYIQEAYGIETDANKIGRIIDYHLGFIVDTINEDAIDFTLV